jgi:hypothetical protein
MLFLRRAWLTSFAPPLCQRRHPPTLGALRFPVGAQILDAGRCIRAGNSRSAGVTRLTCSNTTSRILRIRAPCPRTTRNARWRIRNSSRRKLGQPQWIDKINRIRPDVGINTWPRHASVVLKATLPWCIRGLRTKNEGAPPLVFGILPRGTFYAPHAHSASESLIALAARWNEREAQTGRQAGDSQTSGRTWVGGIVGVTSRRVRRAGYAVAGRGRET